MKKTSFKYLLLSIALIVLFNFDYSYSSHLNFSLKFFKFDDLEINKMGKLSDYLEMRRGRGSFGGRRSSATRPRTSSSSSANKSTSTQKSSSFGGSRTMTSQQAKAKYGTPRKTETKTMTGPNGAPMNYNVHHYGGFSSGLMTGYLTGQMMWYMTVPAFFYSRPVYVKNPDGTTDVYPPTFNWSKLFFILLIIAAIYFIYKRLKSKNSQKDDGYSSTSFG